MKTLKVKNIDEENQSDLLKMHDDCLINLEQTYERPPLAISIGENRNGWPNPFGTFGNISLIKGEEKARKSFLKSLLLSSAIGGQSIDFNNGLVKGHDLHDKYILDLDGEQDEYYAWSNGIRIPKMVGILPENYKIFKLREKTKKERFQFLEWLFMESDYRNKLGVVSIDGYVDFCKNFNDLDESDVFTQALMKYSSISKAHITGILHLNPGTTKARGHLGTILQQKCESVVIISDRGEYSLVECQRGRDIKFPAFTLRIDNNRLPFISDDPIDITSPIKSPFKY